MITRITSTNPRVQGTFHLTPGLNLLVGPNGSGKSTLIKGVRTFQKKHERVEGIEVEVSGRCRFHSLDFEHENPRTQSYFGKNISFQVAAMFQSHGEVVKAIVGGLDSLDTEVIILDEPESALDVDGQLDLRDRLTRVKAKQVLIATHSPVLWTTPGAHHLVLGPNPKYIETSLAKYRGLILGD